MDRKPNILILMADQMQHNRMGFVDGIAHTPNLDAFSEEAVQFTHAFTSQGQCVPARAVFMTGQPAHQCGVMVNYGFYDHQNMMTQKHTTLPSVLRDNGYRTAHFGKRHFGYNLDELGIDVWDEYEERAVTDEEVEAMDLEHVPEVLRKDYRAAHDAVDYLKQYEPDDNPLYFVFSTNMPHPPFFTETKYSHLFPPEEMQLPESFYEETFDSKPAFHREHAEDGHHGAIDEAKARRELAEYYSMIAATDEHVGMVIDQFKRLGIWENTLVFFFADHGDMMGAHKTRLKGTLPYDEIYRIPCMFKLPSGQASSRNTIDDLVVSEQFPATILDIAGVSIPGSFHGKSFAKAFGREQHPEDDAICFEHYAAYWGIHPFYAVRTRIAKYVQYYAENEDELYDLAKDPHELVNQADNPAYAGLKQELKSQADKWWTETGGQSADYYESDHFRENRHNVARRLLG